MDTDAPPPIIAVMEHPPAIVAKLVPGPVRTVAPIPAAVTVHQGYPVRASWWTHPDEVHAHLMSGEHRGKWDARWVAGLTRSEAESLHSDDHEGRVQWNYVVRPAKTAPAVRPKISFEPCPTGT